MTPPAIAIVAVIASFASGFLFGRMRRRRTEAEERAEAAAAALEGFSRVDGQLLPLPTDPRWRMKGSELEIDGVIVLKRATLDDSISAHIGDAWNDKLPDTKRLRRYARAVAAACRERVVRGGIQ